MTLPITLPPPVFTPLQPNGIYVRLRPVGTPASPISISDIDVGEGGRRRGGNSHGYPREGQVYVPTTGYIDVIMTDSVVLSYEAGSIRGFINNGLITAEVRFGPEWYEALEQKLLGWADYNDSGAAQPLLANTWTQVTNDAAGALTNETFLPYDFTKFWDTVTNSVYLVDAAVGDVISLRTDLVVTPTLDNSKVEMRLNFPVPGFTLPVGSERLDAGAGVPYQRVHSVQFYIGFDAIRLNGCTVEVRCSSAASLACNGIFVQHL